MKFAKAVALRVKYPHIPLCEAIAWTNPGGYYSKERQVSWFGDYSRHHILFAHAWHALLWGPVNRRCSARLGACARLETEDEHVKLVYGSIVRREHSLYVGWSRLDARHPGMLPPWPGTYNMRKGERAWIESTGYLPAVQALALGVA